MAKLLSCVLGPRLYKIYRERDTDRAASSVPETPTAVPAASSSSSVSRVPPGGEHGMVQTALRCARPARPLWETGEPACQVAVAHAVRLRALPGPLPVTQGPAAASLYGFGGTLPHTHHHACFFFSPSASPEWLVPVEFGVPCAHWLLPTYSQFLPGSVDFLFNLTFQFQK